MFKFLRKYNKWILAVGGTLLMIVFLIPQALEGLAQSAGTARATRATVLDASGTTVEITASEWALVEAEYQLINSRSQFGPILPSFLQLEGAEHWFLLAHEAETAGLVGPPGASQLTPDALGGDPRVATTAIAKLEGIYRLMGLYQSAGLVSDHRLRQYARQMLHTAGVELIVIPASAEQSEYQPTEAELQEQLTAYGELAPGEGEMGFGYRLPDRFKLEWLSVPVESVREAIRQSDQLNNIALQAHWMRELRDPNTTLPEMSDDPQVPDEVREHLLEKLTEERLAEIARFANDQFRAGRRGLSLRDGYVVLPENWAQQRLSFTQVAQEIQDRYGIETPEYHAIGDRWLEFADLDELDGIGTATTDRFGTRERDIYELIYGAREFNRTAIAPVQEGVAGPPLRGDDGSVYLFRIVDVDTSRPPHSVDEVREQLVSDLQRKAHYEQLTAELSAIEQQVLRDGMLATALEYDQAVETANVTLTDPQAMQPEPSEIPGIGVNREATRQIIDRALTLPADVPMEEVPEQQRVLTLAVDDALAVLAVRITENRPLTEERFEQSATLIRSLMLNEELGFEQLGETFSFETLAQRHQFQLFTSTPDDEEIVDLEEVALGG